MAQIKEYQNRNGDSLTSKTFTGLSWMFFGSGLQSFIQFLVIIILSRLLTPSDFGTVAAALIVIGFSNIFSQLGVGQAIVQRPELEETHVKTGNLLSITLGTLFTMLCFFSASLIAEFFRIEDLKEVLQLLSIVFIIQSLSIVGESLLQRELKFRQLIQIQNISYLIGYGLLSITLALLGFGVWSLVMGQIFNMLIKTIFILLISKHPKGFLINIQAFKELMYFGGGFTLARVFNYLALQGDNFIVGRWLGSDALGLYSRAYQLMLLPANIIGQVLDKVLFPVMAKVQNEKDKLTKAYKRGLSIISIIVIPISTFMFIFAPEIIHFLLGSQWDGVIIPFQILTIGMFFRTSYKMSESIARATGAVYRRAWRQAIYAIAVIIGAFIGKNWGVSGVAIAVLFALIINFSLMAHLSLNIIKMSWKEFLLTHTPAIFLTLFSTVIIWLVANLIRTFILNELIILTLSILFYLIIILGLVKIKPSFFLGEEGSWVINLIKTKIMNLRRRNKKYA